ncbi:MAG: PepSY domain-containing protein [Pseudomonadales bacterium]
MRRFIRNSHKYVSLAVSIQLLLWTVSGLFFAFNKIQEVRGEHVMTRGVFAANVSDFAVDVSEAKSIRILSRLDSPILILTTAEETLYLDQNGASLPQLSSDEAMAVVASQTRLQPLRAETVTEVAPGDEFRGRPLPLYRVIGEDQDETVFNVYVNPFSGEITAVRSTQWRIWDFMWGLHIMDWQERDNIDNLPMKLFSILALISAISGIWLFFASWKSRPRS